MNRRSGTSYSDTAYSVRSSGRVFIAGVWLAFFGLLAMYVAAALLTRLPTESTVPGLGPNVGVAALLVDVVLVFQSGGFLTLAGGFVLLLLGGRMITALV